MGKEFKKQMSITQKIRCHVAEINDHGDHVYTVTLNPQKPVPKFSPGQFLHLALDEYDPSGFWPESRVFSIASSPFNREIITISYSVKGRFTSRMENELRKGSTVWIKLPYGDFIVKGDSDVVLFAGGTGITAFTSFLDTINSNYLFNIYLIYGARNVKLLLYREKIEICAQKYSRLVPFYFVENLDDKVKNSGFERRAKKGIISLDSIWSEIREPTKTVFYLSGPPKMLTDLKENLCQRGIPKWAIKIDSWL